MSAASPSAVVDFPGLRAGVAAVLTRRGLLFHDAYRWQLFLVRHDEPPAEAFRFLREQGLVEGAPLPPESPRTSQMFAVHRDEAPAPGFVFSDDARFQCSKCGTSCRSFNLGPLPPGDVDGLLALDWSGTPHAALRFFIDREGAPLDGEQLRDGRDVFLRRENGACQFLGADDLCGVHARFGEAQKPHICRSFPVVLRASPGGVVAGLRLGDCARAEAALSGPKLSDDAASIRTRWNEVAGVSMLPALVWLAPGALVAWSEYEAIERGLLDSAPAGGGLEFLLRCLDALSLRAPPVALCPPADLAALHSWLRPAGLPVAPAAKLDAAALALEERIARLSLFSKDPFKHPSVLDGVAHLAVGAHLARALALDQAGRQGLPEATARNLNDAVRAVSQAMLREHLAASGLDARAVAAALR